MSCGHALPPSVGSVCTRERLWLPPLHDTVHVLHGENAPWTQSVAHACVLQLCVSVLCGHARPPYSAMPTVRVRDWLPAPHDLVQVLQLVNSSASQAIGQSCPLQSCVSDRCGQALPPLVGSVCTRERLWLPPSHDLVHVLHAENAPSTQSVAHGCVLQLRVSARYGHT
jgi:hypothetical protein